MWTFAGTGTHLIIHTSRPFTILKCSNTTLSSMAKHPLQHHHTHTWGTWQMARILGLASRHCSSKLLGRRSFSSRVRVLSRQRLRSLLISDSSCPLVQSQDSLMMYPVQNQLRLYLQLRLQTQITKKRQRLLKDQIQRKTPRTDSLNWKLCQNDLTPIWRGLLVVRKGVPNTRFLTEKKKE